MFFLLLTKNLERKQKAVFTDLCVTTKGQVKAKINKELPLPLYPMLRIVYTIIIYKELFIC